MPLFTATIKAYGGASRHMTVFAKTAGAARLKVEEFVKHSRERVTHVAFAGFAHELA